MPGVPRSRRAMEPPLPLLAVILVLLCSAGGRRAQVEGTGPDRTGGGGGDGSVGLGERVAGRCRPLGFSTGDRGAPAPPRLRLGVRVCEAGRRLGAGLRLRQPLSRAGVADRPLPARGRVASGA